MNVSKFNQKSVSIKTVNKDGHAAYSMTDKAKLITQVLTSFFNESKFYGDNSSDMLKTIQRVAKTSPEFIAKLAVFARKEFNMRSVAHVLTACLANEEKGKAYVRSTVWSVCQRGDDLTEIMSFYLATFGKPIPNALKRGINDVLGRMDEYSLAKYKGTSNGVKMRDLLCLCHPKPRNDAQSDLWKRLLENNLATPLTWETQLSANGNNRETWEKLIDSGKVGYMAMLRNLRNIIIANPRNIEKVFSTIEDPDAVRRSKQLPFRFLSAYKSIQGIGGSRALDALENAVSESVLNMPVLRGTTVIAVDVSGSMSSKVSDKSDVTCGEIGMLLGVIANRICENSIFFTFDDKLNREDLPRSVGILYATTHRGMHGGATNMELPFKSMQQHGIKADRIIFLSDNQCNMSSGGWWYKPVQTAADEYRKATGNDLWVHAIDLQGYGTQQFHGPKTNIIAGWSEKVFAFIKLAENGIGSLEKAIDNYDGVAISPEP